MVIKMTECGTTSQNLLKDFGDYPYLDEFIEALLNGRTEVRCLGMGAMLIGTRLSTSCSFILMWFLRSQWIGTV